MKPLIAVPGAALMALSMAASGATCQAVSAQEKATLIELFTSEGCNSCPPADKWLSQLAHQPAPSSVVALSFHVDYWDYLGWRDRFGSARFTARQKARQAAGSSPFVYTPQVVVNGADYQAWRRMAEPARLARTGQPAQADIHLAVEPRNGGLAVQLEAATKGSSGRMLPAVAYLALVENGLASDITAGENGGHRLLHDFVVREWVGPLPLDAQGHLQASHEFRRPDVNLDHASVTALVERSPGLEPLQALTLPICR